MKNVPVKIIVHHTAANTPNPQFLAINQWHKERDFPKSSLGFFVGYHYVIEKNGELKQAREDLEEGAHTFGQNFSSIGVCLVGNFSKAYPTKEQLQTLGNLLVSLCNKYNIEGNKILPHRTFGKTECFGNLLKSAWAEAIFYEYEIQRLAKLLTNLGKPS